MFKKTINKEVYEIAGNEFSSYENAIKYCEDGIKRNVGFIRDTYDSSGVTLEDAILENIPALRKIVELYDAKAIKEEKPVKRRESELKDIVNEIFFAWSRSPLQFNPFLLGARDDVVELFSEYVRLKKGE